LFSARERHFAANAGTTMAEHREENLDVQPFVGEMQTCPDEIPIPQSNSERF